VNYMFGGNLNLELPKREERQPDEVLRVSNLEVRDGRNRKIVDNVTLSLGRGNVLGIAGVAGNGQKELAEALVGLTAVQGGKIELQGQDLAGLGSGQIRKKGVGYIPEEGAIVGIVNDFTVAENLALTTYDDEDSFRLNRRKLDDNADSLIQEYGISPPDKARLAKYLSGGNLQKVLVARELSRLTSVLVAYNPTKGLDAVSTALVHSKIVESRNRGAAIIILSEDLDEIVGLSDLIGVMFEGRLVALKKATELDISSIGSLMSGHV